MALSVVIDDGVPMLLDCELIIFDCDGVLVDTEPMTTRLIAESVSHFGWQVDQAFAIETFKGRDMQEIVAMVGEHLGRPVPELTEHYRAKMYAELEAGGAEPIAGAVELLDALDALAGGPKRCVASNGPRRKMQASLLSSGIADRFGGMDSPTIFSAYDISKWKPDPALFLHAAAQMGANPERCVVFEDSESGIEAAVRAGMRSVGVGGLTPTAKLSAKGATFTVETLHELLPLGV
jgi:HAD superfamily hydrolase (TIGR01509 family)